MAEQKFDINVFTTRMRQLILKHEAVKKENDELYVMVEERDKKVEELEKQVETLKKQYDTLKMAKMLEVTDGDMEMTKKRVAKLLRDVNKCITMLSQANEANV